MDRSARNQSGTAQASNGTTFASTHAAIWSVWCGSRGSVARYVWDLAGLDRSGWVVPMGSSGDPRDPHHTDQMAAWVDAKVVPFEA